VISPRRWLWDPQVRSARLEQEQMGLKPRRRILASVSLLALLVALTASYLVPWARGKSGLHGFLLGLYVSWVVWRLAEAHLKDERFERARARDE
jgi:hypothetical protein